MKEFEIHITGDESILEFCKDNGLKSLHLGLIEPKGFTVFRQEYMTSFITDKYNSFKQCKHYTLQLAKQMKKAGVDVVRVKIESPPYQEYIDQCLYMETHIECVGRLVTNYPVSVNIPKQRYIATDREYDNLRFKEFREKLAGNEVELCLYDDNIQQDKDWMELWT